MSRTVLVGVDGSDASGRAVIFARDRATALGLELVLAHVVPWSPYSFTTPEENEGRSARRAAELAAAREQIIDPSVALVGDAAPCAAVVRHGDRVDLLIALAREHDATHILIGRTGEGRVRARVFGSVPAQLVQVADVPVTVVP